MFYLLKACGIELFCDIEYIKENWFNTSRLRARDSKCALLNRNRILSMNFSTTLPKPVLFYYQLESQKQLGMALLSIRITETTRYDIFTKSLYTCFYENAGLS